jgi:hypothetical protein
MNGFLSSSFSCASCKSNLQFAYSSCSWITCPQCGALTEKGNEQNSIKNTLPGDDASVIQIGTLGTWQHNKFEVTGRIQFEFNDDSYVNWWHLDSGKQSLWLSESYGNMRIMKEDVLTASVLSLEKMKPGDKIKITEKDNFTMNSFATALEWKTEGELPFKPEDKKFMWIDLSTDSAGLDIHIFDRTHVKAYRGEDVDLQKISLTKIRKVNGWN